MAQNPTAELTKNVLYSLRVARVTHADMASKLGISINTMRRRLDDGAFTFGHLVLIAEATDTALDDLLPKTAA